MELIKRDDIMRAARKGQEDRRNQIIEALKEDIQSALQEALAEATKQGKPPKYGDIQVVIPDFFKGPLGLYFIPEEIESELKDLEYSKAVIGNMLIIW